ncbi:hypothetical protein E2C01_020172 [Portunus trituberculatus]|uniref:Uncharacterized protein n=1 Tax=Portunus trituberculatus TaxID=210409 RepID=A0A5B7DZG5_PORTR|nr:hypothetical protein [Portunus trituberculatus]
MSHGVTLGGGGDGRSCLLIRALRCESSLLCRPQEDPAPCRAQGTAELHTLHGTTMMPCLAGLDPEGLKHVKGEK